ncbi:MAG: homocysteine S-methyltransferase family protein [Synergistetes bacterium]|nr:homocysteine S-methyltransferase family protein [Synergistota bacterium]MCX8127545.1 homocysteine S-methyltransferase family protein [Synergistota bacterium]MDW8191538.1 homocysteine S-methyltransferase family protein [Synergistota bacterium]
MKLDFEKIMILDGAMGTELYKRGLPSTAIPEELNLSNPEIVKEVHKAYVEAGADIITTNSFGGNRIKLQSKGLSHKLYEINKKAAEIAKEASAGKSLVAGSLGPLGRMIEPLGDLSFEEAVSIFKEQGLALADGGVDLFLIETAIDIMEVKAAILGLRELPIKKPIICSLTFTEGTLTVTGTSPSVGAVSLTSWRVNGLGANCGTNPFIFPEIIKEMASYTEIPIIAYPNAGPPEKWDEVPPEKFLELGLEIYNSGANIIGGCCGTTPFHISLLAKEIKGKRVVKRSLRKGIFLTSRSKIVVCDDSKTIVIGERINPSGRKALAEELKQGKFETLKRDAIEQELAGADLIDLNVGVPETDRKALMRKATIELLKIISSPLSFDSDDPEVIEAGLKIYPGKPILNSTTAKKEALEKTLPLAQKYGAVIIGLTITEKGIPESVEERVKAAYKIIEAAQFYGIPPQEVIIDPLTLPAGAQDPTITLETIRRLNKDGIKTILGISNVSHGLPGREILNSAFLAMAISAGLSFAIINPLKKELMETVLASDALTGKDKKGERFIRLIGPKREEKELRVSDLTLKELIIRGESESASKEAERLIKSGEEPFSIIEKYVIPGLEDVGEKYEKKIYFLPQLIASAEAASSVFETVKAFSLRTNSRKGRIVMATVEGDLHDLGKKIVGLVLESFGYEIIDLGKDVPATEVLRKSQELKPDVVGLSCLMTTTLDNMKKTVRLIKENLPEIKIMVGGAAVNEGFAKACGADGYGKDPFQAVELVRRWIKR